MELKIKSKKEKGKERVSKLSYAWTGLAGRFICALLLLFAFAFFLIPSVSARGWGQGPPPRHAPIPAGEKPRDLEDVRIDQRLDETLPLDALFRDENGDEVKLGSYFGSKPVVLALV